MQPLKAPAEIEYGWIREFRYLPEYACSFFLCHVSFDMDLIVRLGDQLLLKLMKLVDELLKKPKNSIISKAEFHIFTRNQIAKCCE